MKNNLLIYNLILITFLSCKSDSHTEKNNKVLKKETNITIDREKYNQLSEELSGFWISNEYLNNIDSSKTIFNNREFPTKVFGFILNKKNLTSNNPYLNGFTEHEGGYGTPLRYNPKKNKFENDLEKVGQYAFFKDKFEINLIKTNMLEIVYDGSTKKEQYRKVEDENSELRKILFEGKYIDKFTNREIEFNRNGQVIGMKDKNFFKLLYDFGEGLMFDIVFISANDSMENQDIFHYKISNDTLKLFKVNGDIPEYSIGELKYVLIKNNTTHNNVY